MTTSDRRLSPSRYRFARNSDVTTTPVTRLEGRSESQPREPGDALSVKELMTGQDATLLEFRRAPPQLLEHYTRLLRLAAAD